DAHALELGEELIANELDALKQRAIPGPIASGGDRPIEVVEDLQQVGDDGASGALDVPADVASDPRFCLLELVESPPMLGQVLLKLRRLVRELLLELFDQGRLADAARLDRLVGFGARPPAAIDNA